MMTYIAQFVPAEDKPGAYCVFFPDLEGCNTCGDNVEHALANAKLCLYSYLKTCAKLNEDAPRPSGVEEARVKAENYLRELGLPEPPGVFYEAISGDAGDDPDSGL